MWKDAVDEIINDVLSCATIQPIIQDIFYRLKLFFKSLASQSNQLVVRWRILVGCHILYLYCVSVNAHAN